MKASQFIKLCALVLGVMMQSALFGQDSGGKVFTAEAEGFEITLPADWVEIPPATVQSLIDRLAKLTPGSPRQVFQHGYQRAGAGAGLVYPYILVQTKDIGPVPEAEIAKAAEQPDFTQNAIKGAQKKMTNIIKSVGNSTADYDYQRHVLHMRSQMQMATVGTVNMATSVFLTSKGTLNFYAYYRDSDHVSLDRVLLPAMDSVKLAPGFAYVPPKRGIDFNRVLVYALVGGVVGAGIGIGKWLIGGGTKKASSG